MRIEDICKVFTDGDWIESKDQSSEGIRLVQTGNIGEGKYLEKQDRAKYISEETFDNLKCTEIFPGDILVSRLPEPVGRACIIPVKEERMITAVDCTICRPDEKVVLKEYLCYFMQSEAYYTRLMNNVTGTTRKRISRKNLGNVELNIPNKEIQAAVVEKLNILSHVIDSRKEELEKLDDLIKARFVEFFGERGKVVPLTDYVWFQEGPGVRSVDFTDNGTILLTGSNINNNEISFGYKSDRFISNDLASGKYAHFICDKDDILVVSSAIAPEKFDKKVTIVKEDKKYCLNTGIIRFKPNLEVMTLGYFREFLKTDYFKHQVMAEMRGIAQMHFGPSHLKQMTILLPESIEQQIEFEKFVKQVDKSKVAVQKALDEAQTLFDSLMQEYFG